MSVFEEPESKRTRQILLGVAEVPMDLQTAIEHGVTVVCRVAEVGEIEKLYLLISL